MGNWKLFFLFVVIFFLGVFLNQYMNYFLLVLLLPLFVMGCLCIYRLRWNVIDLSESNMPLLLSTLLLIFFSLLTLTFIAIPSILAAYGVLRYLEVFDVEELEVEVG